MTPHVLIKLIKVLQFPSIVISLLDTWRKSDWFARVVQKNCELEGEYIEPFADTFLSLRRIYFLMFVVWIAVCSFDTLGLIFQCILSLKQRRRYSIDPYTANLGSTSIAATATVAQTNSSMP
jgi:hypothetical protein